MAPTVEDCDRMIEAAKQSGRVLMVGHICRFDPRVAVELMIAAMESSRTGNAVCL